MLSIMSFIPFFELQRTKIKIKLFPVQNHGGGGGGYIMELFPSQYCPKLHIYEKNCILEIGKKYTILLLRHKFYGGFYDTKEDH